MMIGDVIYEVDSKKRSLKSDIMNDTRKESEVISPPAKRMKQARLPFQALTNKTKLSSTPSPQLTKKPKLADKSSPFFSGPGKVKHVDKHITPIKKADTPQSKKPGAMKGRKIGFSSEVAGKPCAPPESEVSSSSEDTKPQEKECDSTVTTPVASSNCSSSASPKKMAKTASLDRFVQSTQQPQVSTSAIIDLTDADDEMEEDDDFEPSKTSSKKSKPEKRKRESPSRSPTSTNTKSPEKLEEEDDDAPAIDTSMSSVSSLDQASSDEESSKEAEEEDASNSDGKDKDKEILMKAVEEVLEDEKVALEKSAEVTSGEIPNQPTTPSNALKPVKKTPMSAKALQRIKELEEKKQEKQRQREERKRKLEEENEMKKRQKLEQRKAKEEEKELLRKQKAEEKKKKEMEKQEKKEKEEQERLEKKKAKEEERLKKLEEIDAKQEEKKKKQEERLKQEEEKKQKEATELLKKTKQSMAFKSFFSVQAQAPVKKPEFKGWFAPFETKADMVLAPCVRVAPEDLDLKQVDQHLQTPSSGSLYLDQLKSGKSKPRRGFRTPGPVRPAQENMDVDVPSTSEETTSSKKKSKLLPKKPEGLKMKMIQFHENYRPAYYGTWQKKTSIVTGRNPFKKDEDNFDYDVDSDDEWEEPGESLSHSEGEDEDGEGDDDDEDEDGFFVPHGYLSAGEGGDEEEDTDHLKARQAAKAKAWENELKRRCEALKPMIITFIQVASTNKTRQDERKKLEAYQAMPLTNLPIATSHTKREKAKAGEESVGAMDGDGAAMAQQRLAGGMGNKLKPVPEEAMPELVRLVHGNMAGIKSLIREFRDHWRRKQHRQETTSPGATSAASPDGSPSLRAGDQGNPARESPVVEAGSSITSGQDASPSPVPGSTPSPKYLDHIDHVISKRQLDLKINSIAVRERRPQHFKRICWYVHDRVLERYKLTDLPVPTSWVNGVGVRDGQASPLPPTNIAARPTVAATKPVVSKPVVVKAPSLHEGSTVSSLLKASKEQAALAKQHIFIPSNTMPSAFNKVVGVSSAPGTMHLPGATQFPMAPSVGFIPTGNTIMQPGLAPFQVVPLQMQQAINPTAFNLLQQAAASSLLANMQQTSALGNTRVQPPNIGVLPNPSVAPQNTPGAAQNNIPQDLSGVKQKQFAPILKPAIKSPPSGGSKLNVSSPASLPSLPSVKKTSPQRLQTAIAKLYQSNPLLQNTEKANPAPVKKTKTLANFFNVQNPKKSEDKPQDKPQDKPHDKPQDKPQEIPSEPSKE